MEKFSLKKLNEAEAKEGYRVEMWSKFMDLQNVDHGVDINKSW